MTAPADHHLQPTAVTRFIAGTLVDDHERATFREALLRALVAGPYAASTDQDTLRQLFAHANTNLLARLLEDHPPHGPHPHLAAFLAHVLRVGAALLRLAADTDSLHLLAPHLSGHGLPEHPHALPAHLIQAAATMQADALAGDITGAHQQAAAAARLVRLAAAHLPGTLAPLADLTRTDLTAADDPAILRDYCDLAAAVLTPT